LITKLFKEKIVKLYLYINENEKSFNEENQIYNFVLASVRTYVCPFYFGSKSGYGMHSESGSGSVGTKKFRI
jgi:hypothetical protein